MLDWVSNVDRVPLIWDSVHKAALIASLENIGTCMKLL